MPICATPLATFTFGSLTLLGNCWAETRLTFSTCQVYSWTTRSDELLEELKIGHKAKTKEDKKKLVKERLDAMPEQARDFMKQRMKGQGYEVGD